VRNAEDAGAIAVVVFDNVDGPLIPMAKRVEDPDANVPSVFVSKDSGVALETLLADPKHGETVVVTLESPESPFRGLAEHGDQRVRHVQRPVRAPERRRAAAAERGGAPRRHRRGETARAQIVKRRGGGGGG
jgi:hypothetical protein